MDPDRTPRHPAAVRLLRRHIAWRRYQWATIAAAAPAWDWVDRLAAWRIQRLDARERALLGAGPGDLVVHAPGRVSGTADIDVIWDAHDPAHLVTDSHGHDPFDPGDGPALYVHNRDGTHHHGGGFGHHDPPGAV